MLEGLSDEAVKDFGGTPKIALLRVAILMFGQLRCHRHPPGQPGPEALCDALGLPAGIDALLATEGVVPMAEGTDEVVQDAWKVMESIREIQQLNGPRMPPLHHQQLSRS